MNATIPTFSLEELATLTNEELDAELGRRAHLDPEGRSRDMRDLMAERSRRINRAYAAA